MGSVNTYILTDTKLYTCTGLLNIKEEQLQLYRVTDMTLKLPLGQRIFGCGSILVYSKDKTTPQEEIVSIKGAREALRKIEENVDAERKKYKIHERDMIGATGILDGDSFSEE